MRITHETYRRAAVVAIIGFILHAVLTVVVFILGFALRDHATQTAGFYMLAVVPVWVALILVFHQHRLERLEVMEQEQLRSTRADSSIFEDEDDDLTQAQRLRWMHNWLIPAVSLLVAGLLIGLGLYQRSVLGPRLTAEAVAGNFLVADPGVAGYGIGFTVGIAVFSFIVSWYLGGMSRHPAWGLLRAGASISVGVALINGALAVGYGFQIGENPAVMRFLGYALPIFMVLMGIEVVVSFILNLYTPRRPGQMPRPAFDSRLLGLLAAPESVIKSINDAINYQFGFSVTSTWFYQLVSRQVVPLILVGIGLLVLLNCVAIVQPDEEAVVTSLGTLRTDRDGQYRVFEAGPVVKWPWERVERYPVSGIQRILLGAADEDKGERGPILWDAEHGLGSEDLIIVRDPSGGPGSRNFAVLNAEVPVQFTVKQGADATGTPELINYINFIGGRPDDRIALLKQIATRAMNRHMAALTIDDILGAKRADLSVDLRRQIQEELDRWSAGVEVVFVGAAGIHPPQEVATFFEEVILAREYREATIQGAKGEAIKRLATAAGSEAQARTIADEIRRLYSLEEVRGLDETDPEYIQQSLKVEDHLLAAGGTAANEIVQAKADRWATHMTQLGRTIRHTNRLRVYEAAPAVYQWREYLNVLSSGLKDRKFIITPDGVPIRTTINLQEDATMLDIGAAIEGVEAGRRTEFD